MASARRGKTSKKPKAKVRARSSKSTRLRKKTRPASRRRSKSASKASAKALVKSRKSAPKRQAKAAAPRKRARSAPPEQERERHEIDTTYYMTVEEIETTPSVENHLQTDLWESEIPKP